MKKIIVFVSAVLLITINANAQRAYWGMTSGGGNYCRNDSILGFISTGPHDLGTPIGGGVIFKTDKYGRNQKVVHKCDSTTGFWLIGSLTQANNGKLYGLANNSFNTNGNGGALFEIDPVTNIYTPQMFFPGNVAGSGNVGPVKGTLLSATNGKLYGLYLSSLATPTGNPYTLFSFDPITKVFTNLYNSFGYFSGYPVNGRSMLMQAGNGKIYIPFEQGGGVGVQGALYEYNPNTNAVTFLYRYANLRGSAPGGPLVEFAPGVLYGTFTNGDTQGLAQGGVYKYDIATNTHSLVARLDTISGLAPYCGLTRVGNKLYGATYAGGFGWDPVTNPFGGSGIIFEFDPANNKLSKLYELGLFQRFDTIHNYNYVDAQGWGTDLFATNGLLYGLTASSMFSFNVATAEFTSLLGLSNTNGYLPQYAKLIETCTKPFYTSYATDTVNLVAGQSFAFTVHTPNTDSFTWIKNNLTITSADSTLRFNPVAAADSGTYTCRLVNECGSTFTNSIVIKVTGTTPVTLLNFTAVLENKNARLNWQTSSEYNNAYFQIERSIDGVQFTAISRVNGNGTSSVTNNYLFNDIGFWQLGAAFYRLRQVDINGQYRYSNVVFLKAVSNSGEVTINPNPAKGSFTINLPSSFLYAQAEIYDSKGSLLKRQICRSGNTIIDAGKWQAGEYFIKILTDGKQVTTKKLLLINK